ncbi:MAG: 50S ribosomal protein L24 [uncultured bacterium]|nr:MAG: 50S ribosomal protein L24 [uncultured bacterium]HBC71303.1 50S ribosomal protein L24 [Coxiellaceae bacterium]HBS51681.1 50S ribosomal protein L24 [Coxiellaceae bacterium]HBY55373.1 50S ribosomal protein L24 [Coxiellaceae bacterium]
MHKIKKGDEVIVLTGKSKGLRGKVLHVVAEGKKAIVEGANLIKKHVKPNPNTNTQGGIVEREAALDISNIAIYNPITKKADRVAFKVLDGKKVRCFKSNGELVEV